MIDVLLAAVLSQGLPEPSARDLVRDIPGPTIEAERFAFYERLARSGHERLFTRDARSWFPYMLHGLLSDNPKIADVSMRALRELCARHRVTDNDGDNPVRLDRPISAGSRAELYKTCVAWHHQNKDGLSNRRDTVIRWTLLMRDLRAGGAWNDAGRPEGRAFSALKSHGSPALTALAAFIADDDLLTSQTAVRALNALTGRDTPLPAEGNRDALRAVWQSWLRDRGHDVSPEGVDFLPLLSDLSSEDETLALLRRLETGDIEARTAAVRELRPRLFRHELRLRQALDTADTPEVRVMLSPLLDELPDLKQLALDLRSDPVWLRSAIVRLRRETPDIAAFGRRVERLAASLQELWTEMRDLDHRRETIMKACDLDLPGRARWGDALTDWDAFEADVDPAGELRDAVNSERKRIHEAAAKDVENVRLEALRRFRSAGPAESNLYLGAQALRFQGTEAEESLQTIRRVLLAP